MIKFSCTLILIFLTNFTQAKLLDKVAGEINDKIYTLSEVDRIKSTIPIRKEIAPFIYKKDELSRLEILNILQNTFIIKDKLSELGFIIGDDTVEARINETQKQLQMTRPQMLVFLESKGITMTEYFELIRSAMEFKIFQQRIIAPLITITDQEMKNFYYKVSTNKNTLSFKYKVVDYTLATSKVGKDDYTRLPKIFEDYRKTGSIPAIYSDFAFNDLGEISDEDLPKDLSSILKKTSENSFSELYVKGGQIHLFYVSKKEMAESQDFLNVKPRIYAMILQDRAQKISDNWLSREALNYHILKKI